LNRVGGYLPWIAGGLGSSPTTPITRSRRPRSAAPNPSHHPGRSLLPASMNQEHYLERYPGFSTGPATVEQLAFDAIISGEPNRVSAGIYRPVVQTRQRPILEPPSQIPRSPLLGNWLFGCLLDYGRQAARDFQRQGPRHSFPAYLAAAPPGPQPDGLASFS
jgi:hypothetical protein